MKINEVFIMNFEEFTAIMCDLEELKYVEIREFKDHCFIKIVKQENDKTTDLISEKITNIETAKDNIASVNISGSVAIIKIPLYKLLCNPNPTFFKIDF